MRDIEQKFLLAIRASNPLFCSVRNGFIGAAGSAPGLACYTANNSTSWRGEVENSLRALPAVCKNILSAHDIKIVLAGHPADIGRISAEPNENDFNKRSEIEIPAYYHRPSKAIVLPETHFNKALGKNVPMYNVPQMIMHEVTHALDDILKISEQPEAVSAYRVDAAAFTSKQNVERFGYLLRDNNDGRGEAVAEMGGLIWTGRNVTGAVGFEWHCLSSWMDAYFNEIAASYKPGQELTTAFRNAAAKKAENTILREFIVEDDLGHNLMSRVVTGFSRRLERSGSFLADTPTQKKQAIQDILYRQGNAIVTSTFIAHEKMKSPSRPDLSP